jgi:hypothetical protein
MACADRLGYAARRQVHEPRSRSRAVTEDETIYFQAGTHTDTMRLRRADFEPLVKPAVAEFGRPG